MSLININFRDIRSELDNLPEKVVDLCAKAKENCSIAQVRKYTVSG
jgi:hypothetical protein